MWGDSPCCQHRFRLGCNRHGSPQDVNDTLTGEPLSPCVDEYRCLRIEGDTTFTKKRFEHRGGVFFEGYDALYASLAVKQNLARPLQVEVCSIYTNRL